MSTTARAAAHEIRRGAKEALDTLRSAARAVTGAERPLPDFVVIGAQKAGTSTLYARLVAHPRVLPALRKEVHEFDRGHHASSYRSFFPTRAEREAAAARAGAPVLSGEATPFYLFHPGAPARMHAVMPDVRLIAVLREPASRAVSGYYHARRMGHEDRAIDVALDPEREEPLAPIDDLGWYDRRSCPARLRGYLARGRYAPQLERWSREYPRDQMLVLETAELRDGTGIGRAFEFLGLEEALALSAADRNVGSYPPAPAPVVARLRDHFAPYNEALDSLVGRRLDWTA